MLLKRYGSTPFGTFGELTVTGLGFKFQTVERPWLNNMPSISCVPLGRYELIWRPTTTSVPAAFNLHTWYLRGETVGFDSDKKLRQNCAIHIGNTSDDVVGCIAVGFNLSWVKDRWAVISSRAALEAIYDHMRHRDSMDNDLTIIGSLMG